jgi:hypothetical protein
MKVCYWDSDNNSCCTESAVSLLFKSSGRALLEPAPKDVEAGLAVVLLVFLVSII